MYVCLYIIKLCKRRFYIIINMRILIIMLKSQVCENLFSSEIIIIYDYSHIEILWYLIILTCKLLRHKINLLRVILCEDNYSLGNLV